MLRKDVKSDIPSSHSTQKDAAYAVAETGVVEDDSFLRAWEGLPDTIYARPLVKPGEKVSHNYSHRHAQGCKHACSAVY